MALKPLLLSAVLWGLTAGLAVAQASPMQEIEEIKLPFVPRDAVFSPDERFLVAVGNSGGTGGVMLRDLWEGNDLTFKLPRGAAQTVVYDDVAGLVHVVATTDQASIVYRLAPDTLKLQGETEISRLLAATAYMDDQGRLMVGGVPSSPKDRSVVLVTPEGDAAPTQLQASFLRDPVQAIWWSGSDERTFVNLADRATFEALPGSSRQEVGRYEITSEAGDATASFAIAGSVEGRAACEGLTDGAPSTFVAATAQLSALMLLEFDPSFGQFDVLARGDLARSLTTPSSRATYPETNIVIPSLMIGASCNLSVILVANRFGTELAQLTRPADIFGFESVAKIQLQARPSFVRVSHGGFTAAVGAADRETIWLYAPEVMPQAVMTIESGSADEQVVAKDETEVVRGIQRHLICSGYQIGSVDGKIGKRTSAAITSFASANKVSLDLGDLVSTYKTMQSAAPCTVTVEPKLK